LRIAQKIAVKQRMADNQPTPSSPSGFDDAIEKGNLTKAERSLVRRLSREIQFADFMALLMVAATAFSAFATWQTARIAQRIFAVSERPYVGIERLAFDLINSSDARIMIDFRNFGSVSGHDAVARFTLLVDGRRPASNPQDMTINLGMLSPTVPHAFFLYVPTSLHETARDGGAKLVVRVSLNYRGPDDRAFCYSEIMSYDHRSDSFGGTGGDDRCGAQIY
jgi:hypothetical protein